MYVKLMHVGEDYSKCAKGLFWSSYILYRTDLLSGLQRLRNDLLESQLKL